MWGDGYFNEAMLLQVGLRWYDAASGHWISRDMRVSLDGMAIEYQYMSGNPCLDVDPLGAVLPAVLALLVLAWKAYQAGMLVGCVALTAYSLYEFIACIRRNKAIGDEITLLSSTGDWVYSPDSAHPGSYWHKAYLPDDTCTAHPYSGYADCFGILGPTGAECAASLSSFLFGKLPWKLFRAR